MDARKTGQRIAEHRQRAGLGIDELARKSGLSRQTIYNAENAMHVPDVQTLVSIAGALGIGIDSLICT